MTTETQSHFATERVDHSFDRRDGGHDDVGRAHRACANRPNDRYARRPHADALGPRSAPPGLLSRGGAGALRANVGDFLNVAQWFYRLDETSITQIARALNLLRRGSPQTA